MTLHYAWILDDAYVYFRYADNWLLYGNGLVYDRGEYAEGFTSPLWLLLASALRASGIGWWWIVRGLGAVAFALFWLGLVVQNRRLCPPEAKVVNAPLAWLSLHYGALCYFTSGTEGPLVQLAAVATALFASRPESKGWQTAMAALPLVRPELALATGAAFLWLAWRARRLPLFLILATTVVSGGWLAFRVFYYADLFPTTFHLKNVSDLAQGLRYLGDALLPYGWPFVFGAGVLLLVVLARRGAVGGMQERLFLLVLALVLTLWVVRVGGDARHYRYLVYPLALAFCALSGVAESALAAFPSRHPALWAAVAGTGLIAVAATGAPRQTEGHPIRLGVQAALVDGISDAAAHRHHWALPELDPWSRADPITAAVAEARTAGAARERGPLVDYICWRHYRATPRPTVHSLGLTEPFLARMDLPFERPGHKWGLGGPAGDLARVQQWWGREPARGMHRAAVDAGIAAAWIGENLEAIEVVERKVYGPRSLVESGRLALRFPRIAPPAHESGEAGLR